MSFDTNLTSLIEIFDSADKVEQNNFSNATPTLFGVEIAMGKW